MSAFRTHAPLVALLLLTASTGAFDAVGFLALDRVFTGNMTGNVLFVGFGLLGVGDVPFVNNLVAIAGFVVGSMLSGRLVRRAPQDDMLPASSLVLLLGGGVVLAGILAFWLVLGDFPEPMLLAVTGSLAAVMGAQVTAVKPIGNSDVTTIVVTSTIANLSRESRLGAGTGQAWLPRLLAICSMAAGGFLGAVGIAFWGGPAGMSVGLAIFAAAVLVLVSSRRS